MDYSQMLIKANQPKLDDFDGWIFHPGMLYESSDKWWGDFGTREFPHEGIDFCLYRDRSGLTLRLDPQTRIPVIRDGFVRAMFKDYLGQAVVVQHESDALANGTFLSVYAHTKPRVDVQPGLQVKQGDIIATIADTRHAKANILPHLHLSMAIPAPDLSYENFFWNIMRDPSRITLLNPLKMLTLDYRVPDGESLRKHLIDSPLVGS